MQKEISQRRVAEVPKSIKRSMATLEKLWPKAALSLAMRFFFKPMQFGTPEKEKLIAQQAIKSQFIYKRETLTAYTWGASGPLVYLTHGWSGRGTQMGSIALHLAQLGFTCVAFDAPAHGQAKPRPTHLLEFKGALEALIAHKGTPDYLIGHSLGGVASILVAPNLPQLKGLIVIGSPATTQMVLSDFVQRIGMSKQMEKPLIRAIEKKYQIDLNQVSALHVGPKLAVPTLLIYDTSDVDVPFINGERLHSAWPTAKLITTSNLGHRRLLFDPIVMSHIEHFLV